ncbi:MAG: capsular biosynthesis protein [Chitinophagaceae bacterium]|nr:capsular biosynthesis protein [Chitinophagaceae bacterium]
MFKFFSKAKPGKAVLETLKTDIHSHLLPGIDDGSPDLSTSLELIKGLKELGYSKLITTPHIMWDMYQNTRDGILSMLDEMREVLTEKEIDIELDAAAEYFLDDYVMALLKKKEQLLTFGDNMVLVEFSMASPPIDLKEILFEMRMQDYQPVIAHPERYIYLEHSKDFYDELKDAGYLFQLNLLSFAGMYGRSAKELANYLAHKGYYDLVGTDLHNQRHLKGLQDPAIVSHLEKLLETGQVRNMQL